MFGHSGPSNLLNAEAIAVWEKGHPIPGKDSFWIRRDDLGNEIHRFAFEDANSPYGWQKDYIVPTALGGSDSIWNLRPLRCRANAAVRQDLSGHLQR